MNSTKTVIVGVGVTAVAATVAVPLFAGSADASTQTLKLSMHSVSDTNIDNGKSGFSAGDDDVQTTNLVQSGSTVGWEAGDCLTTRVGKTADQVCRMVFHLKKGEIVAVGAVRSGQSGPGTFKLAITGGTGSYDTAHGQVSITAGSGSSIPVELDIR